MGIPRKQDSNARFSCCDEVVYVTTCGEFNGVNGQNGRHLDILLFLFKLDLDVSFKAKHSFEL